MPLVESPLGVVRVRVGTQWLTLNSSDETGNNIYRVADVAEMLSGALNPKLDDLCFVVSDLHTFQYIGPDSTQAAAWHLLSSAYFTLNQVPTKADLATVTSGTKGDLAFVSDTHALYVLTKDDPTAVNAWVYVASRPAVWENINSPADLLTLAAHQNDMAIVQYSDVTRPTVSVPATYVLSNDEPTLEINWIKLPGGLSESSWEHIVSIVEPGTGTQLDLEEGALWLDPDAAPPMRTVEAIVQEVYISATSPGGVGRPLVWADTSNASTVPTVSPYLPTTGGEMTGYIQMTNDTQINMATGAQINFGPNTGDHIYLYDSGTTGAKYGIGIQSGLLAFFVGSDSNSFRWRLGSSTGTDWMALDTNRLNIHGVEALTFTTGDSRYHKKGSTSPMNYNEVTIAPTNATIFDGQNKLLYNDFMVSWCVSVTANSLTENTWQTCVSNTAYDASLRPRFQIQNISNFVNEGGDAGCIGVRVRILTDGTVQFFKPGNGPDYETNSPFSISFTYPRY